MSEKIVKGIVKTYNAVTHTADVLIIGASYTYLSGIKVATNLNPAEMITNRTVAVLYLSQNNPTDCVIIAVWADSATPTVYAKGKMTEIDFGSTPIAEKEFTVTDADVTATSKIVGCIAYVAPTGKDLDELEFDAIDLKFAPGAGQLKIYAKGLEGYVADKFKVYYIIS
jgi:hypothetical protein